jgi:hypothetical protein
MDEDQITSVDDLAASLDAEEGQAQDAPNTDDQQVANDQGEGTHETDLPAEGDEAAAKDAGQAQAPADDVVVKWATASGETIEAPLAELKSGYLRQQDYTQKTQQLADERKQASEAVAQQFQQAQQLTREQAKLMTLHDQLTEFQKADWTSMYAQDPQEAGRLQAIYQQRQHEAQQLAQSIHAKSQQHQQLQSQQLQEATAKAFAVLQRDIQGFGEQHVKAARDTALAHGYTDAELNGITDPRVFKVLNEAAQWRALQAKKPAVQNRVQATPPKASKPGVASTLTSKAETAWKQMQARGDVNSLAAFIQASEI